MPFIYLDVPFTEKEHAKKVGASWDPSRKRWRITRDTVDLEAVAHWLPSDFDLSSHPVLRRIERVPLKVMLIPKTAWGSNLRKVVSSSEWSQIKQKTHEGSLNRCQACLRQSSKSQVHCHELWHYDDETKTQRLLRTVSLCSLCHLATHYGYAELSGKKKLAVENLCRVNRWNRAQAQAHIEEAFSIWRERSKFQWRLDVTWILDFVQTSEKTKLRLSQRLKSSLDDGEMSMHEQSGESHSVAEISGSDVNDYLKHLFNENYPAPHGQVLNNTAGKISLNAIRMQGRVAFGQLGLFGGLVIRFFCQFIKRRL